MCRCNQVRALIAGLVSSIVSSLLSVLCRHAFKQATKGGEAGRAIKLHKWRRERMLGVIGDESGRFDSQTEAASDRSSWSLWSMWGKSKSNLDRGSSRQPLPKALSKSLSKTMSRSALGSKSSIRRSRAVDRFSEGQAPPRPPRSETLEGTARDADE